jgi:hypothetical protein
MVALPTSDTYRSALQTGNNPDEGRSARLFAKTGLWFRRSGGFELVVPENLRGRLSIGWESVRAWRVVVPACPDANSEWVVRPGGYWVADPMCATLLVRSNGQERAVTIGLGTPCPGQSPPDGPSDK